MDKEDLEKVDVIAKEILDSYTAGSNLTGYVVDKINKEKISPASVAFMLCIFDSIYEDQLPPGEWDNCKELVVGSFDQMKKFGAFDERPVDAKLN